MVHNICATFPILLIFAHTNIHAKILVLTMKRSIVFLMALSLATPASVWAQGYDDEMYFVPSKKDKSEESKIEIVTTAADGDAAASSGGVRLSGGNAGGSSASAYAPASPGSVSDFDVDAYNRRSGSGATDSYAGEADYSEAGSPGYAEEDTDGSGDVDVLLLDDGATYTARIIRFHNPTLRIYLDSPYWIWDPYWDYVYDPWYYRPWYYSSYWGFHYGGWYWGTYWGWYPSWHYHPGPWAGYPHHGWGWRPRNVTNRMGWRSSGYSSRAFSRGGVSAPSRRASDRGFTRGTGVGNRSFGTSRGTTVRRFNGNTDTPSGTSTRRARSFGTTNRQPTTTQRQNRVQQPARRATVERPATRPSNNMPAISRPSRSFVGSTGGGGSRSFGGGSRGGGGRM